jgi:solute carrier family 34 (sodium-dependent phosphate cotransporter)
MADRTETRPGTRAGSVWVARAWWAVKFVVALFFFVGSLQLMKEGAASLDILNSGGFLVKNAGATLGLGWVGALFVLSGSPVAATALTLVAADSITEVQGYTMLTGSRLGAAFVVLVVAVIYALRGGEGERFKPVSTAIMALSTTAVLYVPAAILGLFLLRAPFFSSLDIQFPAQFADVIDFVYGGLLDAIASWPPIVVFLGGLGVLLLSFKLIDAVIPELNEETRGERRIRWLRQKWTMFGLGCLVALVTMSVSVALTVLVPLVAKKYVKREDIVPYIMGANITTLGDTLLAAFALNSGAAVRIVLAGIITTTILSLIALTFFYVPLRRLIFTLQRVILRSKPRLAAFTAALFLVPIVIVALSNLLA